MIVSMRLVLINHNLNLIGPANIRGMGQMFPSPNRMSGPQEMQGAPALTLEP